jgi:hypothetical protein
MQAERAVTPSRPRNRLKTRDCRGPVRAEALVLPQVLDRVPHQVEQALRLVDVLRHPVALVLVVAASAVAPLAPALARIAAACAANRAPERKPTKSSPRPSEAHVPAIARTSENRPRYDDLGSSQ